jgi:hypothetical protein
VIASATQFLGKDGTTEVELVGSDTTTSLQLQHSHNALPFFHGNTSFQLGDKKVHWKGHSVLVDDATGVCFAFYKAKFIESKDHKLGNLLITAHGADYVDIIVISALVEQERSDEAALEVNGVSELR